MWKTIAGWLLAFFGMARELDEHRARIRRLEDRLRDHEEALKLVAQELRHARQLEAAEREKQMLRIQREVSRLKDSPGKRRDKREPPSGFSFFPQPSFSWGTRWSYWSPCRC